MKRAALILFVIGLVVIALIGVTPRVHGSTTTLTGTILDAQGNGVNGTLTMQLPIPAQDTASNTAIANTIVSYKLVNGVIQSGPPLYDVAGLQPANLFYAAKVYDRAGNVVMAGNYVVTGGSFNLGAATPTSITTSNISYVTPVTTSNPNTFTAAQTFSQINSATTPIAFSGFMRLGTGDSIVWRNFNNTGDLALGLSSSALTFNGNQLTPTTNLTAGPVNFGSSLSVQTIVNAMPATQQAEVVIQAVESLAGVGCSGATNFVTPTINWTGPGGTVESLALGGVSGTLNFIGNGTVDTGSGTVWSGSALGAISIVGKSGTAITYTVASTLASTGCTTVPQFTVYVRSN